MKLFRKLHNRVEPPGLEWKILKRLPQYLVAATVSPVIVAMGARAFYASEPEVDIAKRLMSIDIFCVAVGVTSLAALLTVGIGCLVVHIMKGPGYAADSYDVPHSDRPKNRIDE
jgi:hypothetical protein